MEFKFHPPRDPLIPASQPLDPPFVLLTHKNNISTPLLVLAQQALAKKNAPPGWVKHFLTPDPDDPESFRPPQCVMIAHLDPTSLTVGKRAAYYRFDPSKSLTLLLRNTHFVEFPTIELWEEFHGTVVDTAGIVTQQPQEEERPLKRRKITGKKAMNRFLGEYGSDEEEKKQRGNVLSLLGEYGVSDDEDLGQKQRGLDGADSDEGEEIEIDPGVLLELMRRVQDDGRWEVDNEEDEQVDWGDWEEE